MRPAGKPDPTINSPTAVGNLRAVVYTTSSNSTLPSPDSTNQGLHFFWTHPDDYVAADWHIEVQRRVALADDHPSYPGWQFVSGSTESLARLANGYGEPQFTVDFSEGVTPTPPTLWGDSASDRNYRVRYVNQGPDGAYGGTSTDDVNGVWATITIPAVTTDYYRDSSTTNTPNNQHDDPPTASSTLPIILGYAAGSEGNPDSGLRFAHNADHPRDRIDLMWNRNENARPSGQNQPNGYVIDRSADGGATWHSLDRADTPTDLGTGVTFTDSPGATHKVIPGMKYKYRVFPVFIESGPDAYGLPAVIDASSRGADLPTAVRNLVATAKGQTGCEVMWDEPRDSGGHPVTGYLIQVAVDSNGNPGAWMHIPVTETVTETIRTTTSYTHKPKTGTGANAPLSAGSVRWFRVIPVTKENDGKQTTGGSALDASDPSGVTPNSPVNSRDVTSTSALPLPDDAQRAVPVKCQTEGLGNAPDDPVINPPQIPLDLTAEAASDTNALADQDRGVFLTWNQALQGDASATASYRIERKRMNTGIAALNDTDWRFVASVTDVTSWTDATDLRQDGETRMYRVGSKATGLAKIEWSNPTVDYALHPASHAPAAPVATATANSATQVTVSWTAPDTGGSAITGYKVQYKLATATDYGTPMAVTGGATASSYQVTGLTASTGYDFQVIATNAQGDSAASTAATATTQAGVLTAPTNVTGASSVSRELTLTWQGGEGAEYYILVAVDVAAYAAGTLRYETASVSDGSARTGTVSNLTSGTSYLGIVFAAKGTGSNMELLHAAATAPVTVR